MAVARRPIRALETLEPRTLFAAAAAPPASPALDTQPTVRVVIDYSLDNKNFFDTQQKKDLLQQAADSVVKWFKDDLLAIEPGGGDSWEVVFDNPATGARHTERNVAIPAGEVLLFAGGRDMTDALGRGGPGGYNASGSGAWLDRVARRGQGSGSGNSAEFGPWGGAITFDTDPASPWFFGQTTAGLADQNDFLSVATHEVTHLFGFGTSDSWRQFTSNGTFTGPRSLSQYDVSGAAGVPLNDGADHWAEGTRDNGQDVSMDPQLTTGTRRLLTPLDYAALDDVGWSMPPQASLSAGSVTSAGSTPFTFTVNYSHYAPLDAASFGGDDLTVLAPDGTALPATLASASGSGNSRTVRYSLAPQGGTWDGADSGTYAVVLGDDAVRSSTGEAIAGGTLGTFVADIAEPPSAQLQPPAEPAPGATGQTFTVVYTDSVAVDPVSIDVADVIVIAPDGTVFPATSLLAVDGTEPASPVSATYGIGAPGGSWGPEDDGRYTVSLRPGAVRDTSGNATPGGPVGTFDVSLGAVPFDARHPAVYTDASGDAVTVLLKGPGTATVRFTSTRPADASRIELHGTTAASSVVIKTGPGGTGTGDVTVEGALKSLTGKAVDLTGALSLSGPLGKLLLRSAAGSIAAPAVRQIICKGDFSADVTTGTLGMLKVGGALAGADIRASTGIGKVFAASIRDSRLFAGVSDSVTLLPVSVADFANPAAVIGAVSVRSKGAVAPSFSNTLIAAPILGKLSLGPVRTDNAGKDFGVAGDRVTSFTAVAVGGMGLIRRSRLDDPAVSLADGDFVLRLL
jgi:hypothetical protein